MTPKRWQQVKAIFNSAIKYRPEERGVFLSDACAGDNHLRSEVESLIASHEKTGSFIDAPAYEAVATLIVDEKSELKPGQFVGAYEIVSFIGRGGMLRPDGYVKVLDFGLAKLSEQTGPAEAAEAPTIQVRTGSGIVIGTAAYMV